jgi:hypothetical protein
MVIQLDIKNEFSFKIKDIDKCIIFKNYCIRNINDIDK